ncbi:MAG TPA: tetratricopeptide repeat protein [Acidimicrobiia bacterium]
MRGWWWARQDSSGRWPQAWSLWWLADAALHVGRLEDSLRWSKRAEDIAIATFSKTVEVHALTLRGDALRLLGDRERALPIYELGLGELADHGDFWCRSLRGEELASMLVESDRPSAIELLEESAAIAHRLDITFVILRCATDVARLATHDGEFLVALELFAPYDVWTRAHVDRIESKAEFRLEVLESTREPEYSLAMESVEPQVRDEAWARGAEMSVDDVYAKIMAWLARERSVISTRVS